MAKAIKFIPPQIDALACTTTEASRKSPLRLLVQDVGVLVRMLPYLPWLFIPLRTPDKTAELHGSLSNMLDFLLNSSLFLFQSILLLVAVPAFLILPGGVWLLAALLCVLATLLAAWPMQGSRIAYSRMDDKTTAIAKQHESERWLFINGCMTGHSGLQENIDRISRNFGRSVVGVHNESCGLIADLLECVIQRCFSYNTRDTRVAYDYVKACAVDPIVTKLVLIGHSQGGIVISLILDQLFADIPSSCVSKLEVYTFGSAASHFKNPHDNNQTKGAISQGIIPHIEHYCNEYDMVPRWGVLYNTCEVLDNRYAGTVFVRMDATGHMFNQHYMNAMFPLPHSTDENNNYHDEEGLPDPLNTFLDQIVDVDEKTARKRDNIAIRNMLLMKRQSSLGAGIEFGDGHTLPVLGAGVGVEALLNDDHGDEVVIGNGNGFVNGGNDGAVLGRAQTNGSDSDSGGERDRDRVVEARGKTVRDLSRLWMYLDGGSPSV